MRGLALLRFFLSIISLSPSLSEKPSFSLMLSRLETVNPSQGGLDGSLGTEETLSHTLGLFIPSASHVEGEFWAVSLDLLEMTNCYLRSGFQTSDSRSLLSRPIMNSWTIKKEEEEGGVGRVWGRKRRERKENIWKLIRKYRCPHSTLNLRRARPSQVHN